MGRKTLWRLGALGCLLALCLAACAGGSAGVGRSQVLDAAGGAQAPLASIVPDPTPTPDAPAPGVDPSIATDSPTPSDAPPAIPEGYVAWGKNQVVEHIFFHPVIAYPQWAFHDCPSPQERKEGLDDWMVTVDEYNKILQNVYDKGYVLVDINDVWKEEVGEDGAARMVRQTLAVPAGKKPLILSFDDTNYYDYMLEQGFTSKLVLGEDGEIWAQCTDPYTQETFLTQDLDAITILDKFVREHPDFSPSGAKGCLSLTGYQGILGYRTQTDRTISPGEQIAWEFQRMKERAAVRPIIARLKETGWTFGSHTWGHIRLSTYSLEAVQQDTERWLDEVGSLVGETQILFYPHGARPDGDHDQGEAGPMFQYLQSKGFRVFASVGVESYSKIKSDISAVICDRLHPDGTTLRWQRKRYLQFYDAKEIMDTAVRPDLGYKWED